MTRDEANAAAERVVEFLQQCDDPDIRAGVGAILGLGNDEKISAFKDGIASAILAA